MDLRSQRRMASRILKCGTTRVWMDPSRSADIAEAITSGDIRKLINDGVIKALPKHGISSFRRIKVQRQKKKGRRLGRGSRKGSIKTRMPKKENWMRRIRAIRRMLTDLKSSGRIDAHTYRDIYTKSKSGLFRSRSHVTIYLERNKLLKGEKKQ